MVSYDLLPSINSKADKESLLSLQILKLAFVWNELLLVIKCLPFTIALKHLTVWPYRFLQGFFVLNPNHTFKHL
jgi:hypothetical protein